MFRKPDLRKQYSECGIFSLQGRVTFKWRKVTSDDFIYNRLFKEKEF